MPEIILFEHDNFRGAHKHIYGSESNLNAENDNFFNDRTSSIAVLSGTWLLYRDADFRGQYISVLGPGLYSWIEVFNIKNDDISSLQPTSSVSPTNYGTPINGHAILFEHQVRGAHKHVFNEISDLNYSDSYMNDKTSSIAILQGNWCFYKDSSYGNGFPNVYGPGSYPRVEEVGITNDTISSLKITQAQPTIKATCPIQGLATLFEHRDFRGAHMHVINSITNLNTDCDNFFNDRVSSVIVHSGTWAFFRDSDFRNQYANSLTPGNYNWVEDKDIKNDDISSARVIVP